MVDAPERGSVAEVDDGEQTRHAAGDAEGEAESHGQSKDSESEESQIQDHGGYDRARHGPRGVDQEDSDGNSSSEHQSGESDEFDGISEGVIHGWSENASGLVRRRGRHDGQRLKGRGGSVSKVVE